MTNISEVQEDTMRWRLSLIFILGMLLTSYGCIFDHDDSREHEKYRGQYEHGDHDHDRDYEHGNRDDPH